MMLSLPSSPMFDGKVKPGSLSSSCMSQPFAFILMSSRGSSPVRWGQLKSEKDTTGSCPAGIVRGMFTQKEFERTGALVAGEVERLQL